MQFSIKYKVLLLLFVIIIAVASGMWLMVRWSFERGLLRYVSSLEEESRAALVRVLAEEFKSAGGWERLRDNRERWRELLLASLPQGQDWRSPPMPRSHPRERGFERRLEGMPAEMRFARRQFRSRHVVLDADRNPVIGRAEPGESLEYLPVTVDGVTVGWLGARPRVILSDEHELRFAERQARAFAVIALVMMALAALIALPMSRRLVQPIRRLSAATRELAAGQYGTRIPSGGSDELGQLSRDFNTLAHTLEQNERSRRQWIADISHELRTPLSILQGEIEALQDGVREPTPERLAALHSEALNLARLVNDLYELSLSDIGALSYHRQELDAGALLDQCLRGFADEFAERRIAVEFAPAAPGAIRIFADPDRLQQLFANLAGNALRYTDPGGRLRVTLAREAGEVTIDFQDSAPGVPEEHLPKLFERLYRVETSRSRASGGAGLGLAICRNIVEAHGGRITAQASPLGGLWIRVVLPAD
jgi:two-component system sensor histidine kinase BaeS